MWEGVDAIDWAGWEPTWRATLLFLFRGEEVLLIHKKTGFGKGKINGPGGRIEPGETPVEAAVREVMEEVCVEPASVSSCGELYFQFQDGFSIQGYVFRAEAFTGQPMETREARPFWQSIDAMPYDRMWADDRVWFPRVVDREGFRARFLFDGEIMLDHRIEDAPADGFGWDEP